MKKIIIPKYVAWVFTGFAMVSTTLALAGFPFFAVLAVLAGLVINVAALVFANRKAET
jgi:hypothetical protein